MGRASTQGIDADEHSIALGVPITKKDRKLKKQDKERRKEDRERKKSGKKENNKSPKKRKIDFPLKQNVKDNNCCRADVGDVKHPLSCIVTCPFAVIMMPVLLDDSGAPIVENKNDQVTVVRNCLAAGLVVSWYLSSTEEHMMIRISADDHRLHIEAERIELKMRQMDDFNKPPEQRTPIECFDPYRKGKDGGQGHQMW